MKTHNLSSTRPAAGVMMIECLVYLAVFLILSGIATAMFYFCWDHTRAVVYATDDVTAALRAGERWRADVRAATGTISVETTPTGQMVWIPEAQKKIIYAFENGEVRRQNDATAYSEVLLPKVKSSTVKIDAHGEISAWRWEVELSPRRKETRLPLLFTFEAVQPNHENPSPTPNPAT